MHGGWEVTAERLGITFLGTGLLHNAPKTSEPATVRLSMANAGGYHERLCYDNDWYVFFVRSFLAPCDEKKLFLGEDGFSGDDR